MTARKIVPVLGVDDGAAAAPACRVELQAEVDSLTARFLERTRRDVARLREIISEAYQGDRSSLAEAKRVAHSIHGAGAMFGLAEVSVAGGSIEQLIKDLEERPSSSEVPCSTALLQEWTTLTEQLGRFAHGSRGLVGSPGMFTQSP